MASAQFIFPLRSYEFVFLWSVEMMMIFPNSFNKLMRPLRPSRRYKMISEFTWPNHDLPSDKDAVKRLMQGCGFDHDVAYGKTKVFIRTPRTLFSLEEQRAEMVQRIVLFLQKVNLKTSRQLRSSDNDESRRGNSEFVTLKERKLEKHPAATELLLFLLFTSFCHLSLILSWI